MPAKQYVVVKQPCGQEYMGAKALQGPPALHSSADAPASCPIRMYCTSMEPPSSSGQQAVLACPALTEDEEEAALQCTACQSLGAGGAAPEGRGGPVQCLVGQPSLQLEGKACSPADSTRSSGLVTSSSEQQVRRHLNQGPSCSTADCPGTEQQASGPQAAAAQEPVPSRASTACPIPEAFAQCEPEEDSACGRAEKCTAQGAGQGHRRQSTCSLSTAQACAACMADVSSLHIGRLGPSAGCAMG